MFAEYIEKIKPNLKEKRFNHSLCVAKEARRLAELYGADANKAELAGILHDVTKEFNQIQHFGLVNKYKIPFTKLELETEKLWHAKTGAVYAKEVLGVKDEEIISAIAYHTTGRENMTLLEQVLFLADFTSADRDYEDVDIMRALVNTSKELAMSYALKYTITDLLHRDKAIHPDTFAAYNDVKLKRG